MNTSDDFSRTGQPEENTRFHSAAGGFACAKITSIFKACVSKSGGKMPANASQGSRELYEFGPFRIDAQRELLLRAGEAVPLAPKAFQILLVLVRHSQEVVSKEDLMKADQNEEDLKGLGCQ